jgi:hypothetical protein
MPDPTSQKPDVADCPNCGTSETHLYTLAEIFAGCPACGLTGPSRDSEIEAAKIFAKIRIE